MTEVHHNVEISTYGPLNTKWAFHQGLHRLQRKILMTEIAHDLEISTSDPIKHIIMGNPILLSYCTSNGTQFFVFKIFIQVTPH